MTEKISKRISTAILNSLSVGVVPRIGLEYINVGRKKEIEALLGDLNNIVEGGAAFRFIVGKYGSGKSFLLQLIRNYALDIGFVVIDADLSPERRLAGTRGQGLATYKELMQNMSTRTRPDGGALSLILEKWISGIQANVATENSINHEDIRFDNLVQSKIIEVVNNIEGMVNGFEFAKVINLYWKSYLSGDDEKKAAVLKWFRGEYATKTDAIKEIGVNVIINDDTWYEYLKLFSQFMIYAGYKGLIIIIDELVNIYNISNSLTRQNNYEKILSIFNDTMQGKAKNIGILMGGTPQCIEDTRRGLFTYEALRSRLEENNFINNTYRDMHEPIIKLNVLSNEDILLLVKKIAEIHAFHYGYDSNILQEDLILFLRMEFNRIGADQLITPRELIRDFIRIINIIHQNKELTLRSILDNSGFEFKVDTNSDEKIHEEFAEFEL